MTPPVAGAGSDRGTSPVETLLAIALLLIPMGLLVAVLPTWVEYQHAARTAAREATRVAAHADGANGASDAGVAAAMQVLGNHGVPSGQVAAVSVRTDGMERGGHVTADVTVDVPVHRVPFLAPLGGFTWTGSHTERVDDFRSLPGP